MVDTFDFRDMVRRYAQTVPSERVTQLNTILAVADTVDRTRRDRDFVAMVALLIEMSAELEAHIDAIKEEAAGFYDFALSELTGAFDG